MKAKDFFDEETRQQESAGKNITNPRVFDFDFVPQEPLMREEAQPIIKACVRYQSTGISNNLLIFGTRGSGKLPMA